MCYNHACPVRARATLKASNPSFIPTHGSVSSAPLRRLPKRSQSIGLQRRPKKRRKGHDPFCRLTFRHLNPVEALRLICAIWEHSRILPDNRPCEARTLRLALVVVPHKSADTSNACRRYPAMPLPCARDPQLEAPSARCSGNRIQRGSDASAAR